MSSEKYHYEPGAIHNDHHKEINIGSVSEKALGDIIKNFFNESAEEVDYEEISDETSSTQVSNRKTPPVSRSKRKTIVKPKKPRETMTFRKKSGILDGHLTLLYQNLTNDGWIEGNEADFKTLFSGQRDEDCELTWTAKYGKGTLVGLFKKLAKEGLVIVPDGYTLPAILEGHFKDKSGDWLTGLDKGDSVNDKAQPVIQECVKLLKIDYQRRLNGDDDDEDFQSKYDEFDQQDLHWHKRK